MEKDMEDDYRILAEQERDRLMELHCRAEHAAFNVIEGLNELNRIEAEGAPASQPTLNTRWEVMLTYDDSTELVNWRIQEHK